MGVLGEVARGQLTIGADGATVTIFINYSAPNVRYKFNNNGFYTDITWPCTIVNTNPGGPALKVFFENNVTVSDANSYFICGSDGLQFGSASLKSDGTRPVVTVDGVVNYPGLVQNGIGGLVPVNGYANISIYNLEVYANPGVTSLAMFGGWIGQAYFGKGALGCYIINCSSNGDMGSSSGGIVGRDAGSDGGNLTILGCSSSGNIDSDSGGIAGFTAGLGGEVLVKYSWSSGLIIGFQGGGIFGSYSGASGTATAENCFSLGGVAAVEGGGIFGKSAGDGTGFGYAINCYSRGNISGLDAGGIFGSDAASFVGNTDAVNSYSSGTVAGVGAGGIYGANPDGGAVNVNTYIANGTWSSVAANATLVGTPPGGSVIGTTWADTAVNQPYDFSKFGYSPYSTNNISIAGGVPSLVQSFSQAVTVGSSSSAAVISGLNYTILQKKKGGVVGAFPTITINNNTGVISTTADTETGTYTLTIDNEVPVDSSGYSITEVVLTVNPPPPVITSATTASGTVGSAFTYTITASQNPTSYGASGLPAGLSINAATGVISGTPTVAAVSNVTISATNAGGTGSANLTLTVNPQPPVITSSLVQQSLALRQSYAYQITANNSPNSYGASGLPPGLSVNARTGRITGTPTRVGTYRATLTATRRLPGQPITTATGAKVYVVTAVAKKGR